MYIAEIPDENIVSFLKEMKNRKIKYLVLTACGSDILLRLVIKVLIFEEKKVNEL